MAQPYHPEDRPDPNENMPAMRARVPEHVSRGVFSTGAIVMTGSTEFILDFVQNLGRPHQVVARIVLPHVVMPQFADALSTNIELYRQRFGPLPNSNPTPPAPPHAVSGNNPAPGASESMALRINHWRSAVGAHAKLSDCRRLFTTDGRAIVESSKQFSVGERSGNPTSCFG